MHEQTMYKVDDLEWFTPSSDEEATTSMPSLEEKKQRIIGHYDDQIRYLLSGHYKALGYYPEGYVIEDAIKRCNDAKVEVYDADPTDPDHMSWLDAKSYSVINEINDRIAQKAA